MEAIDLLTDFVGRPRIDAEELDKERGVVIQEIQRYKDQPSAVAEELIDRAALRRPPAGPHRPRARGAPAHVLARGDRRLPRAPLGGRARRRVHRRQPRPRAGQRRGRRAASSASRRCPRPSALRARRRRSTPQTLVEQRDTNQSHLRMIYRPDVDVTDPRAARRADDLLDAAGRLDGLAPVRRDPRAARPLLLGLRGRPRASPTPRPAARRRAGLDQVRRGLRADARDRRRAARRRPDRGGGRARPRLRRRPPRPGLREHQRRRALRGRPDDRLRRGHRPRRGDRRARRRDVRRRRRVARGVDPDELAVAVRRPARRRRVLPTR